MKVMQAFLSACLLLRLAVIAQDVTTPAGQLAYVHNSHLWIKSLPNGEPRQITRGPAVSPRWSASGLWLLFNQDKSNFVVSANGDTQQRLPIESGQAQWSPTKDEIAYSSPQGLNIATVERSGLRTRLIMSDPNICGFVWNQDGSRLAVAVALNRSTRLWTVDDQGLQAKEIPVKRFEQARTVIQPNGQRQVQSPEFELGGVTFAGWSADNQWIFVWPNPGYSESIAADGLSLIAIPADGGVVEFLLKALSDSTVLRYPDFVALSARATEILVTAGGNREAWTNKRLTRVDPATGKLSILTDKNVAVSSSAWSPDGSLIASVLGPDNGGLGGGDAVKRTLAQRHIWVMNADGQRLRQLTSDTPYRDEYPLWSRDGLTIVFVRLDQQNKASVWNIDVQNGSVQKLVEQIGGPAQPDSGFGYYGHTDWSRYLSWSR